MQKQANYKTKQKSNCLAKQQQQQCVHKFNERLKNILQISACTLHLFYPSKQHKKKHQEKCF